MEQRLARLNIRGEFEIKRDFTRAITRHSSSSKCNSRAQLLSDSGEITGNCNGAKFSPSPLPLPLFLGSLTSFSLSLSSFLILLPNNTNYWMKHLFYYAACIHASEIPSTATTECRDRISYQASRGFAQKLIHKWKWKESNNKLWNRSPSNSKAEWSLII